MPEALLTRRGCRRGRPAPVRRKRGDGMLKKLLATLAVVIVGASFVVFGSFAVFTDTQNVPSNTFSTGTLDISTNPTSALVTFSAMAPGDQVTNPITVTNGGTLQLRYAVTSTTTENVLAGTTRPHYQDRGDDLHQRRLRRQTAR